MLVSDNNVPHLVSNLESDRREYNIPDKIYRF